ncbi:MAG TPA: cytochrome b/b6 domain-containing protein, partial [Paenalcaligenes sp.]|nr:cytochrome b/b6 domain-containing protein [Paenalcaligenes sp.]
MSTKDKPTLDRYTYFQRMNHWFIALCFILLAVSGLALFHPSLYWLANILGGGTWTRILHPFIGVAMFIA